MILHFDTVGFDLQCVVLDFEGVVFGLEGVFFAFEGVVFDLNSIFPDSVKQLLSAIYPFGDVSIVARKHD